MSKMSELHIAKLNEEKEENMVDIMVARKLEKVLPNSEAFYTEFWRSGKVVKHAQLLWFFDEVPDKLEFNNRWLYEKDTDDEKIIDLDIERVKKSRSFER